MKVQITYVLLADGGRDRALLPILRWAMRRHEPAADLALLGFVKRSGELDVAINMALARHVPDLLFVHRDAEGAPLDVRMAEIATDRGRIVRVVPVRMTETWLLADPIAIRRAAGCPGGAQPLGLPKVSKLEATADPKFALDEAMLAAAGHPKGRRRERFLRDRLRFAERVATLVPDFSQLLELSAFAAFDGELKAALAGLVDA